MADEAFEDENELTAQGRTWADLNAVAGVDLAFIPKAIHVSSATGGAFVAKGLDGVNGTFYGAAGSYHPIRPKQIVSFAGGMTFTGLKT